MKYEKPEKVNAKKKEIRDYIEKNYIRKDAPSNTGQLRFFKGLLIRDLAPTVDKKLRKDTRFFAYLNNKLLGGTNDEVLSFFDDRKNLDAIKSALREEDRAAMDGFHPLSTVPPLLLLQKAQRVMIQELFNYLRIPDQPDQEGKNLKKVDAYVDLLFSIGIYEIFMHRYEELMIQYEKSLPSGIDSGEDLQGISDGKDIEKVQQEYDVLRNLFLIFLCQIFAFQHKACLYAALRLIATTEYVKIHLPEFPRLPKKQTSAEILIALWTKKQEAELAKQKKHLFTAYTYINHNQKAYANQFTHRCEEQGIVLTAGENEDHEQFVERCTKYVDAMADYTKSLDVQYLENQDENTDMLSESNMELFEKSLGLSYPLLQAAPDTVGLQPVPSHPT